MPQPNLAGNRLRNQEARTRIQIVACDQGERSLGSRCNPSAIHLLPTLELSPIPPVLFASRRTPLA